MKCGSLSLSSLSKTCTSCCTNKQLVGGMQSATDALDRGVQQLFSVSARPGRPTPLHSAPPALASRPPPPAHPLCECLALQPPPPDWRPLRHLPVLKRHVLGRWLERCEQFERGHRRRQRQQQRALDTPAVAQSAAFARRRALVAQSVRLLCVRLLQCGLLHARETAFVQLLVAQTLARGLGDVLLQVPARRSSGGAADALELPLRTRLLLLREVLVQVTQRVRVTEGDEAIDELVASQQLVEDVCANLQEEVLEAIAKPGGAARRDGGAHSRGAETTAEECEFCRSEALYSTGVPVLSASTRATPWTELKELVTTIQGILGGDEADTRQQAAVWCASSRSKTALALATLRNLLSRADVVARLATRTSERPRDTGLGLVGQLGSDPEQVWRMPTTSYEQICWSTVAATAREAATEVNLGLWEIVWKKERQRLQPARDVLVDEIITHCAAVDYFARVRAEDSRCLFSPTLPGYQVVCRVLRALQANCFGAILLFQKAVLGPVTGLQRSHPALQATRATTRTSTAKMCREYLAHLLSSSELEREQRPLDAYDATAASFVGMDAKSLVPTNGEHLAGLFHALYTIFADTLCRDGGAGGDSARQSWRKQWDRLLRCYAVHRSQSEDGESASHSVGMQCVQGLALWCTEGMRFKDAHDGAFQTAFAQYVRSIVRGIVVENGRTISSDDGLWREPLVRSSADVNIVREFVTSIAGSFGSRWISELVFQLLRCQIHFHRRARSAEISLRHQRGLNQFFFPALHAFVHAAHQQAEPTLISGSVDGEVEEDCFFEIVSHATDMMKTTHGTQAAVTTVLRFCTDWDVFQERATPGVENGSWGLEQRDQGWGRGSFPRLQLFVDVLQIYESDNVLASESDDVLVFIGDVLQSATNWPPALEGRLFRLLTRIKNRLENPKTSDDDEAQQAQQSEFEVVGAKRIGPISHTDDALAACIRQLHTGSVVQVREAVERMKSDPEALDDLIQHVLRWVDLMQSNDATFGKETKLGFAVLCNRLLCWLPDENVHAIRQVVTPLDQGIIDMLAAFAEHSDDDDDDEGERLPDAIYSISSSSSGSSVRIEFLIRSFVASSVIPDLCELTDVVTNAIIGSTSTAARGALMKLVQRISGSLLVEVAIETLRLSLSTECLQYVDQQNGTPVHSEDDDDRGDDEEHGTRRSINRLSNTLSIVGLSSALFNRSDVAWSISLFDEQAVRHWLLCFFDCMVYSEHSRALTPIDELLSSLEYMTTTSGGARMAAHSYLLTALFCTAAFPQSRVSLVQWSDFDMSVEEIARTLLSALSSPEADSGSHDANESDENEIIVIQTDPLRTTRARVLETRLQFLSSTRLLDPNPLLSKRLRGEDQVQEGGGGRMIVRFATWLSSAIIYSQSIAAALTSPSESSIDAGHLWEQVFTDYMSYLYLPLEFGNRRLELLGAWLSTWMRMSMEQASGSPGSPLLLLLPFQQKLFGRLGARITGIGSPESSAWRLAFLCLSQVLEKIVGSPETVDTAIVILDDVMEKFDLGNLATFGNADSSSSMWELIGRFEALCADNRMAELSGIQIIHILKHPLEILAFHLISSNRAGPSQWIEHTLTALQSALREPEGGGEHETFDSDSSAMVWSFWYEWTRMIELKYAYLDPSSCELFIRAATEVLSARLRSPP